MPERLDQLLERYIALFVSSNDPLIEVAYFKLQDYRNYATVDIKIEPETVSVRAKLVPITTDVFREGEFDEEYDSDY